MKTKQEKMKDLQVVRRRKIIIQKRISEDEHGNPLTDGMGNPQEQWVEWATVWAKRSELFGQEYYVAKSAREEKTIKFKVKYVVFLDELNTTDYRVVYNNLIFDIKDTDTLNDDGLWFIIKAQESGVKNADA